MMKLAGACVFLGLSLLACTNGDTMGDPNGQQCVAHMTATGTFAPNTATPPPNGWGNGGCWPAGTWTFSLAVTDNNCPAAPTPLAQYSFKGVETTDMNGDPVVNTFTLITPDPSLQRNIVKVSEGGAGLCAGEVDLYSTDGKQVWSLQPEINFDNATISGDGSFEIYSTDQWPLGT